MMRTQDGKDVAVPPDGTLGLLAMGYKGIMLWREARAQSGWTAKAAAESARAMMPEKPKKEAEGKAGANTERHAQKADQAGTKEAVKDATTTDLEAKIKREGFNPDDVDPDAMIPFGN
jgi:hypothetical protein